MRVIAGRFRGRRLASVRAPDLRPTSDRVRESMFDILAGATRDARVLDLYAGTGAIALEAVSRGAAHATCVERSRRSLAALEKNVSTLGLDAEVTIVRMDALTYCARIASEEPIYDMVFCDPPYADDLTPIRDSIVAAGWWTTVCVVEHRSGRSLPEPWPLPADVRRYGDTTLSIFWRR